MLIPNLDSSLGTVKGVEPLELGILGVQHKGRKAQPTSAGGEQKLFVGQQRKKVC